MVTTQPYTLAAGKSRILNIAEVFVIVAFAAFPLFFNLPYRAYVYLSWEGAYRLSEGQLPFKDFGLPLGGFYWVVPAIFFKIFGIQVFTLVKAQAFLNIVAGLAFRGILKTLKVNPLVVLPAVLLFCISYSFQNFWPWYNHTVIVYGLIATYFTVKTIFQGDAVKRKWLNPFLSGLFILFSVFTKHDGGALFFVLCNFLLAYEILSERKWRSWIVFNTTFILLTVLIVLYFSRYGFTYWFNYGQKPHNARLSVADFADILLTESQWLKFYLVMVLFLAALQLKNWKEFLNNKRYMIFFLLTMGILCMASVIQITSYIPEYGNFFFHAFAVAFILDNILSNTALLQNVNKKVLLPVICAGIFLWWSSLPWEYVQRLFINQEKKGGIQLSEDGENIVSMHNFRFPEGIENVVAKKETVKAGTTERQNKWVNSKLKTLKRITIPQGTLDGIERIKNLEIVKQKAGKDLVALNMTELTFLAVEIPFQLERNPAAPLWHHLGVGMFNKQLNMYQQRVENNYYDIVFFEYIPYYNNFFPFSMRDTLEKYYEKVDSFPAPRSGSKPGMVEVYTRKTITQPQ